MRKKGRKSVLSVFVLLTLTIALSACSGDKGSDSSQIIVGIPQDIEDSLDPHKAVAAGTKEVLFNMFEGLLKPDPDGNLIPAVARDYEISEDGKTYTFYLREGVKFHNGDPVTAKDVKYSLEKRADTADDGMQVPALLNMESVDIVDDETVRVTLKAKDTDFPDAVTMAAILPENYAETDTKPVGTGPFVFASRSPQENIILERFDGYWGEKAKLERVIFKIAPNADTAVMDLMGGSIDLYPRIAASQAKELGEGFTVEEGTMNLVQALYLNHDREPFDDLKVRQALCYAADPQEIMLMTADGKGTEIGSSMFPAFGKYYMPELAKVYEPDIEKARTLLKEAGYPDGFSFTITVPSNYKPHVETAQVLAQQLKKVGVTANIELIEWDSWLSDVYHDHDYESTVVGVDASSMTAGALLGRFVTGADGNFINYSNSEYDALYEKAVACLDDEEQTQLYKQMETILTEDAANVYIQDMANLVAINSRYGGYTFYPLYVQDMAKIYMRDQEADGEKKQ